MSADKIAKARRRGMLRSCATQLAALPVAMAFAALLLVIANTMPPDTSPMVVIPVGLALVFFVFILPLSCLGFVIIRARAWRLDRALVELGPGRQYALAGRGWEAAVGGRQVNAWFSRGPQLELYIEGDTGAVAGVGQDNTIVRIATNLRGKDLIEVDGGFVAGGADLGWTKRWLAQPGVEQAVAVLLEEDERSLRSVAVLPDSVRFVARFIAEGDVTAAAVMRWVEAATTCAAAAEATGPPGERQEPGLGSRLRTHRGGLWMGCLVAAGTLGLVAAIGGFVAVIIAVTGA